MQPHQDWNKITFTGPTGKQKKGEQAVQDAHRRGMDVETIRRAGGTNSNRAPAVNMRKLAEEDDVVPVAELPHEFRMAMQKARVAASLSQADLAKRINEKQSVVNDYENGRAVPNPQVIVKIERALNCRLPRPPKEKKLKEQNDH
jgi:putative transcription factor